LAASLCRTVSRQSPSADQSTYAEMFDIYRGLYPTLQDTFRRLSNPLFDTQVPA
jgi:hypothetical protein